MATKKKFTVKSEVWLYQPNHGSFDGNHSGSWHFATVDEKQSAEIKKLYGVGSDKKLRGFGSVPVEVVLGKTTWRTSIFPDSRSGCYLLPLKLSVRKVECVSAGDTVVCTIRPL